MKKILIALFAILMVSMLVTSCDLFKQKGLQGVTLRTGTASQATGVDGSVIASNKALDINGTKYSKVTTGEFAMVCYDSELEIVRGGFSLTNPDTDKAAVIINSKDNPEEYNITVDTSKMSMADFRYPTADIEGTYDMILARVGWIDTYDNNTVDSTLSIYGTKSVDKDGGLGIDGNAVDRIEYILFTSKETVNMDDVELVIAKVGELLSIPDDYKIRIALVTLDKALDVRNNPGKTAVLSITLNDFNCDNGTKANVETRGDITLSREIQNKNILSATVSWE